MSATIAGAMNAISSGTGVGPEGNAILRSIGTNKSPTALVGLLPSLVGQNPLSQLMQGLVRTQSTSTYARTAFAGQEGETPLNFFVRRT